MNYWGSSSTLDPYKVGGFIRVKPLKREAIIVTLIRMGHNLLICLCRHSLGLCRGLLCLSSDSLGDLKKSCPYILTRQMRRIGQCFLLITIFFKQRNLFTMGRSSRLGNFLFKSSSRITSSVHASYKNNIGIRCKITP